MSAAPQHQFDLEELRALATADLEAIAREVMGEPNKALSTRKTWRYGNNGSLKLEMTGRKRGVWHAKDGDATVQGRDGGGIFDLVMLGRSCGFAEAARWLEARYGAGTTTDRPRPRPARSSGPDPQEEADNARAIRQARDMAHASGPIAGTVAETYLVETRGIPKPAADWPDALRFHAGTRSLLVVATLADGSISAVQRVRLTPEGRKVEATAERPAKVTNGRLDGPPFVRLPTWRAYGADETPPLLYVEAPETGIAAWAASGHETRILLGLSLLPKVSPAIGRRVAFCRDDDPRESPADKLVRKALGLWRAAGADAVIATPWPARRFDKSDFADVIKTKGTRAVAERIEIALNPPSTGPGAGGLSVEQACVLTDQTTASFFALAGSFDAEIAKATGDKPPVHGIRVPVGIGKSHAARKHAVEMIEAMRACGDKRSIAFAVPTHRLGSEQQAIFRETFGAHLRVAVWRGRSADDPERPGDKMCQDLEAVEDASSVGLDPQSAVCRQRKRGQEEKTCPFFESCAYQRQRKQTADIWIVPHELIFNERPKALGELAALVVDESAWQDGLEGHAVRVDGGTVKHSAALTMSLDALTSADRRVGDDRSADWMVLEDYRARALTALRTLPDGPLPRSALGALTDEDCIDARQLEFARKIEPNIYPGMAREARREAVKAAEQNRVMLLRARFWKALAALLDPYGPEASGWLSLGTVAGQNGPQRVVYMKGRREVRAGWQVPTLLIDALLNPGLVGPFWPQVELVASVESSAPHQHVRQVTDRAFAKSRLDPLSAEAAEAKPEVARARLRNLREVRDIITREARRWPTGRVLLVAQKGAKGGEAHLGRPPGLIEMGLPPNVETGHHNGVAGMDVWRDVQQLIVVGRTLPRPSAVERMAEALTGAAIEPVADYERGTGTRLVAGRGAVPCETVRHPHPVAEAIRWQTCEGELVQIIGRGRGVNRTQADPLDVLVLTDPPLPLPIHAEISADELAPSLADRMLGAGGVVFENPGHASDAYPELWPTRKGATTAFYRDQMSSNPNEYTFHKGMETSAPPLRRVNYQRAGQRHSPATAWFSPLLCPDPETWLTERLGPLAWCRVSEPSPSPHPQPEPPTMTEPVPDRPEAVGLDPARMFPRASQATAFDPPDLILSLRRPGQPPKRLCVSPAGTVTSEASASRPEPQKGAWRVPWPPPSPFRPAHHVHFWRSGDD